MGGFSNSVIYRTMSPYPVHLVEVTFSAWIGVLTVKRQSWTSGDRGEQSQSSVRSSIFGQELLGGRVLCNR